MRGRELMGGVGKTMMQSGGTFGTFMAIGMGIRCWGGRGQTNSTKLHHSYGTLPVALATALGVHNAVTLSTDRLASSIKFTFIKSFSEWTFHCVMPASWSWQTLKRQQSQREIFASPLLPFNKSISNVFPFWLFYNCDKMAINRCSQAPCLIVSQNS